jgi:hypothetical protein
MEEHSTCLIPFVIPSVSTNSVPTIPAAWETDLNPMYDTGERADQYG